MKNSIRTKVYEIQWGGSIMPYVRYFFNQSELDKFKKETGYKVEVL